MLDDTPRTALTRAERMDLAMTRRFPVLTSRAHRLILRFGRGRLAGTKRGIPIGLLTTTGARSGRLRSVPLMYLPDGKRFLVVPANSGLPGYPAWYHNLRADPRGTFTVHGVVHQVTARVLDEVEHDALWPSMVAHNPLWAEFDDLTTRRLSIIALERAAP